MTDTFTTYHRADGQEIWGDYRFVTELDGLADSDEGAAYIKETWALVTRETVWFGPPELVPCAVCKGSGLAARHSDDDPLGEDCPSCKGEGLVESVKVA